MKNFNLLKLSLIVTVATAMAATASQAQTLITANLASPDSTVINTASNEPRLYENDGDLGYIFKVGSNNLLLSSLGLYSPSTGLSGDTKVNLYALSGEYLTDEIGTGPIASATVAATTVPDADGFAYATVAPTLLTMGGYYLIDYVDSSKDPFYDATFSDGGGGANTSKVFDTADITPLSVTINGNPASSDPGYPTQLTSVPYYLGPNAQFTNIGLNVPEPSSIALLVAGGFAGIALFRLRREA